MNDFRYLHELRFASRDRLSAAFEALSATPTVEGCLVEAEELRLRFVAPATGIDGLLEKLYAEGGLTWCQRHRFDAASA